MRAGRLALLLLLALSATGCAGWLGLKEPVGSLDAVALAPLPPVTALSLEREDRSAASAEFGDALTWALERKGVDVVAEAPFVLGYRAEILSHPESGLTRPDIALAGTIGSASTNDVGVGLGLPILGGAGHAGRRRFVLELDLTDRAGRVFWRGRADGSAPGERLDERIRRLALLLIDRMGQTVPRTPFSD